MIRVKEDSASTLAQANLNLKNFESKYRDLEYAQAQSNEKIGQQEQEIAYLRRNLE